MVRKSSNKNPFMIKKTRGNKIEETFKKMHNYTNTELFDDRVMNKDFLMLKVRKRVKPLAPEVNAYEYTAHDGSKGVIIDDGPTTMLYKGEYMPIATKVAIRRIGKKIADKFNISGEEELVISPVTFEYKGVLFKRIKDSKEVKKFMNKSLISKLKAEAKAFYLLVFGKKDLILLHKEGDGLLNKEELYTYVYYDNDAIFIPREDMINALSFELRKMIRYSGGKFNININLSDILIEDDNE